MLRSSLCNYSDVYILVKRTITVANTPVQDATNNNDNRKVIFKNWVPFINCIRRINNTQVGNAHDIDIALSMYNLIEYGANYSKTFGMFWEYCRD